MRSQVWLFLSVLFTVSAFADQAPALRHAPLNLNPQIAVASGPQHPIFCEFWTGNQLFTLPNALMIYDPATSTLYTRTGVPFVTRTYNKVIPQMGVPPYGDLGYTLVAFGDVPALAVRFKHSDTIPLLAYALDNMQATWGGLPGFPSQLDNGLCFNHPWFKEDFTGW